MEEKIIKIFYGGIASGSYPKAGQNLKKTGLPLEKLGQDYPYFTGKRKKAAGKIQIYYSLLPEYSGKTLFMGKPRRWKKERRQEMVREVRQRAASRWECREEILMPEFSPGFEEIPLEVMAAGLYRCRPFEQLCISLPEEEGERGMEQAAELLSPYLPRMRQVMFLGRESPASRLLEEYLSYEYGIIMMYVPKAPEGMVWLDLDGAAGRKPRAGNHINQAGMLKFLDTEVKNGYNTDVNSLRHCEKITSHIPCLFL